MANIFGFELNVCFFFALVFSGNHLAMYKYEQCNALCTGGYLYLHSLMHKISQNVLQRYQEWLYVVVIDKNIPPRTSWSNVALSTTGNAVSPPEGTSFR